MCRLLRSSLSWSRLVADERPLILNVPMVKFESDRGPFGAITSDGEKHGYLYGRELLLVALLTCVCTARVHPYRETGHHRQELKQVKVRLEGRKNCERGVVWE